MKAIKVLIYILVITSCNKKSNNINDDEYIINSVLCNSSYEELYNNEKYMDSLYELAFKKGDTLAYNKINSLSGLSGNAGKEMFLQQIMAIKYKYSKAYFDMFNILQINDNVDIRKLSIYYLLKASEMGNKEAIRYRDIYYFTNKPVPTAEEYFVEKDTSKFVHLNRY